MAAKPSNAASSKARPEDKARAATVKQTGKTAAGLKRNAKGQFVSGGAGGPGRPAGVGSKLLQMARISAEKVWPKVEKKALAGNQDCMDLVLKYGMPRAKGYADDPDAISARAQDILGKYKNGELSLKDTALELEMNGVPLPDTIRILLAKEEIEPDDPNAGVYCVVTDEEMERRAREREMEQQAQRDGLPQRRAEMAGLHRQVADSHAPGATPAKPAERGEGDGGQSA